MSQNINLVPVGNKTLTDLWNYWKKELKLEFSSHHIGTIQSFDPVLQTAQATINYTKTFLDLNGVGFTSINTPDYPVLVDCPCLIMGGGGGALTFPITKGDECLIAFNDRDMDNWWFSGAASSAPNTPRLHAFADAICIVGLRSQPNVLLDYDDDAVALRYQGNTVKIFDDSITAELVTGESIELTADAVTASLSGGAVSLELSAEGTVAITNETGELVTAINQLFTDVSTATAGGFPLIMPTFATDILVLQSFLE